jgi:uncharacterized membrane protein YeaQ/YmgE (transglycosylase-associated protein family)
LNFLTWIVAGVLLGASASALSGSRHRGAVGLSVALGVAGVMAGGLLLGQIIDPSPFNPGEFSLACLIVSMLGAAVPLMILHEFGAETSAALAIFGFVNRNHRETSKMNERHPAGRVLRPLITASLAGTLMLFGACASTPPAPESALDAARVAISNAEKAEAGQFAGAELGEARQKLTLADNAVRDEDMVAGERLARESQVQAELASARTAAAKAASVNEQLGRGAEALAEEMQRAGEPR